jgi:nicotinamide phosphoribosyltransferase
MNRILNTDSYKASHWLQFPPNTTETFYYLESRGGLYSQTLFFGLQYIIKEYLETPITLNEIKEASSFFSRHGVPFNETGWMRLIEKHQGRLPIKIRAVAEGSVVENKNVLMTVQSTDPEFFWIPGYIETLLMRIWYPITVATKSLNCKRIIKGFLEATSDDLSGLPFKLHDFGSRGVSSRESAAIGGAAHLVNFMGSDTVDGVILAEKYYGTKENCAAYSIPAAEHSTITSWGKSGESAAYQNMLTQFAKPGSLLAVVSDSYDLDFAVEEIWGTELKQKVIESGATVVIRPDSGDPVKTVSKTIQSLDLKFGSSYNKKGFKLLNNVRILQGDGVNEESIRAILVDITSMGYSADNIAFGMGGALLQKLDRDTQKFAYKCSCVKVNNQKVRVFKQPKTDPGKTSKGGYLDLRKTVDGKFKTEETETASFDSYNSSLLTVFENGVIKKTYTLDEIRINSNL